MQSPNTSYWPIFVDSDQVGYVTSAVYSPRLDKNIALAIMNIDHSTLDTVATVETPNGSYPVKVVRKPFYDPKKKLASIT